MLDAGAPPLQIRRFFRLRATLGDAGTSTSGREARGNARGDASGSVLPCHAASAPLERLLSTLRLPPRHAKRNPNPDPNSDPKPNPNPT